MVLYFFSCKFVMDFFLVIWFACSLFLCIFDACINTEPVLRDINGGHTSPTRPPICFDYSCLLRNLHLWAPWWILWRKKRPLSMEGPLHQCQKFYNLYKMCHMHKNLQIKDQIVGMPRINSYTHTLRLYQYV